MRYLYVLVLFALGMVMVGAQHTHDSYEVYGVARKGHTHSRYADSGHDHDYSYPSYANKYHNH